MDFEHIRVIQYPDIHTSSPKPRDDGFIFISTGLGISPLNNAFLSEPYGFPRTENLDILHENWQEHKKRIEDWLKNTLLDLKTIAYTRSYEVALSMVEAELGVVVLPALTSVVGLNRFYDVKLYKTNLLNRRLVALTPNPVSYTHLRAHETPEHRVFRLLG